MKRRSKPGLRSAAGAVLRRLLPALLRDTRGATAMMFALALLPMFGAIGLAVDSSLGYILRSRLSKSLDVAALAAGRVALSDDAEAVARKFFDANFAASGGSDIAVGGFTYDLDDNRQFVTLTASATAPTYFMRIFGKDSIVVTARTVIERQTSGLELALVMDITGSMNSDGKFNAMQTAAFDLIDIIYGDETEVDNLYISLVPYTSTVNIGNARTDWLAAGDRVLSSPGDFSTAGWKGCVEARANPMDADDTPPGSGLFTSFYYAPTVSTNDNNWPALRTAQWEGNNGRGPNLGCGPAITPLTKYRSTIDTAIGNMAPWSRGGTTGNLGLSWGWRTISPRWRGLWQGETPPDLPLDYDEEFMEKVVVILTDGENQFYDNDNGDAFRSDYTAYGRLESLGVLTLSQGRAILDSRMAQTCASMKAEGIRIYTITFGSGAQASAKALYETCATLKSMYYHAPTNTDLAKVFRAIGGELANLRIVE